MNVFIPRIAPTSSAVSSIIVKKSSISSLVKILELFLQRKY